MSLYLPESKEEEKNEELVVTYEATKEDEEKFMLIYHMNIQPSEVDFDTRDAEKRRWLFARFMMQKKAEQEAYIQQRMAQKLMDGGGLKL